MQPTYWIAAIFTLVGCGGELDPGAKPDPEVPVSSRSTPPSNEVCGNGLDDDGDGQVDEGCACNPSTQKEQACFPGAASQRGVGQCRAGTQLCQGTEEFATWGTCKGAVLASKEDCSDGIDNDCNGVVDDGPGCACKPGATRACYTGAPETRSKGQCKDGKQTCNASGMTWDPGCSGEVLPGSEICHDTIDNNCDGQVDEGCIVTVNVDINGDCVWASCPPSAPHPVGCNITMAGGDCRGCIASSSGSSKVYFQEGNQCGAGHVSGQLFCSSVPGSGVNAGNCSINKQKKYYETNPASCPALGDGTGC